MTTVGGAEPTAIGRYRLQSVLGIGGFATVHRGYDTSLESDVAVKVLLPQYVAHADIRARFVQEAQLLRRVESPHVVRVYDIGELDDARPYFVMEYLNGGFSSTESMEAPTGRRSHELSMLWPTGWARFTTAAWCTETSSPTTS